MVQNQRLFEGSIVALVTPMLRGGTIDIEGLKRLIHWHIESGTRGIVIMGTTGESALVDEEELVDTVAAAIEFAKQRIPVIAGCGTPSTQKSVALATKLSALKPDALLCVTPYYVNAMQTGLVCHYSALADASESPIILYNVPGRTACDLADKTIISLSEHQNIIGLKDATADLTRLRNLRAAIGSNFSLLSGDDETSFDYVEQGGDGVVSVTANLVPREMVEWVDLLKSGSIQNSREIFDNILPLHQALFVESNPIPVKWALSQLERIEDIIRLPLTLPSEPSQQIIKKAMQQVGVF